MTKDEDHRYGNGNRDDSEGYENLTCPGEHLAEHAGGSEQYGRIISFRPCVPKLLQLDKLPVFASFIHEVKVSPCLNDGAPIKDVDHVGMLDSAETVGDCNCGSTSGSAVQRNLNSAFRLRVEGGCSFVEKEDLWSAQQSFGNCEALLLAA